MKNKSELKLTISDELAERIIQDNPKLKAGIHKKIVSQTGSRVIKKILNDEDLLRAAKRRVEDAIDELVKHAGLKKKSKQWNADYVISDTVKKSIMPKIEKELEEHIRRYADKIIRENIKLRQTTNEAVDRAMYETCKTDRFVKMIKPVIEETARATIKEMLG